MGKGLKKRIFNHPDLHARRGAQKRIGSKKAVTLADLQPGERAVVRELSARGEMRRRLQDLGFVNATRVSCVLSSPLGDPRAYRVRGTVIALRRRDAATVLIRKETSHE